MSVTILHLLYQLHDTKRNTWVVLYSHIAQQMTQTANAYIAAAYLAIMLLSFLAYCRG